MTRRRLVGDKGPGFRDLSRNPWARGPFSFQLPENESESVAAGRPQRPVPATGNPIRVDGITIHRVSGGKIAETWQVWDTLSFLPQIGVIPTG